MTKSAIGAVTACSAKAASTPPAIHIARPVQRRCGLALANSVESSPVRTQSPGGNCKRFLNSKATGLQPGYGFTQVALQLFEFLGLNATEVLEACSPLPERLV